MAFVGRKEVVSQHLLSVVRREVSFYEEDDPDLDYSHYRRFFVPQYRCVIQHSAKDFSDVSAAVPVVTPKSVVAEAWCSDDFDAELEQASRGPMLEVTSISQASLLAEPEVLLAHPTKMESDPQSASSLLREGEEASQGPMLEVVPISHASSLVEPEAPLIHSTSCGAAEVPQTHSESGLQSASALYCEGWSLVTGAELTLDQVGVRPVRCRNPFQTFLGCGQCFARKDPSLYCSKDWGDPGLVCSQAHLAHGQGLCLQALDVSLLSLFPDLFLDRDQSQLSIIAWFRRRFDRQLEHRIFPPIGLLKHFARVLDRIGSSDRRYSYIMDLFSFRYDLGKKILTVAGRTNRRVHPSVACFARDYQQCETEDGHDCFFRVFMGICSRVRICGQHRGHVGVDDVTGGSERLFSPSYPLLSGSCGEVLINQLSHRHSECQAISSIALLESHYVLRPVLDGGDTMRGISGPVDLFDLGPVQFLQAHDRGPRDLTVCGDIESNPGPCWFSAPPFVWTSFPGAPLVLAAYYGFLLGVFGEEVADLAYSSSD